MRINRSTSLLLSATMAVAVAAPAAANRPQEAKDQTPSEERVACDEEGDNEIVFLGDLVMWPPNHKTQTVLVSAVDNSNDDDPVTIFTSSTHDEYLEDGSELNGSGNTDNDAEDAANSADPAVDEDGDGVATTSVEVRSERSGRGDGRTYTISATAMFGEEECSTEFFVEVPHDMRSESGEANGKNGGASLDEDGEPKGNG